MANSATQWQKAELDGIGNQDNVPGYTNTDSVERKAWSVFAEDMYQATDNLTLTAGLRLNDYDGFGQHLTPRLYANYSLTPEWTLRAGVARGFKAPTLRQVTAEYCMTTGGSSLPRGPLCGNPDLEPEESTTQELGIRYDGSDGRSFGLTLFNNDFENKVVSYDSGQADSVNPARPLYVYDNIDEVRIRGVELSAACRCTPTGCSAATMPIPIPSAAGVASPPLTAVRWTVSRWTRRRSTWRTCGFNGTRWHS